jgi:hypothetical protein
MDAINTVWFWVLLAAILYCGLFFIPSLLMKHAIRKVIEIFCRHDAVGIHNAKTIEELGLRPRDFWQNLMRLRDYKPYALDSLKQAGIVRETEAGKIYMAEDRLDERWRCSRLLSDHGLA